jgi:hypothetical protein
VRIHDSDSFVFPECFCRQLLPKGNLISVGTGEDIPIRNLIGMIKDIVGFKIAKRYAAVESIKLLIYHPKA